ncbi:hypothetical protein BG003_007684 [Podila horticola]|nr:hypothetical protein BG003_007684 [Podila horticola]
MFSRTISIFDIVLIADRIAGYLTLQDMLTCVLVNQSWHKLFGPHRWKVVHILDILHSKIAQEALRPHSDWVHTAHLDLDTDYNLIADFAFSTWCPNVHELYLVDSRPSNTDKGTTNAEILTLLAQAPKLTTLALTWYNCHPNWDRSSIQYLKPPTLKALSLHGALADVTLNLQYNLNASLIPQILCSLPAQIRSFKLVAFTLLALDDWEWDHDEVDTDVFKSEELLAKKSHPSLTHLYLGIDCSGYAHDTLMPFFQTCPNIQELHLAPMDEPSDNDDDEDSEEAMLSQMILKHCRKISKMILAPQFSSSGLWSDVSLRLLEELATIEHLFIDGEWGQPPPPITAIMVQKWSTSLTMLEYVSHSLVKSADLLLVLAQCVNLLEIKTTKGWGPNDNEASQLWSLDWGQCGVHVEELLAQPWGCLKLERVSIILVECTRRSPKVEDEATQRRVARKVIEFHRQLKMLDNLQVLELYWYFPYLEQMEVVPEDTWCHPMGQTSKKLLAQAIPRHEQTLMAVEWTEYPRLEEVDVDILQRGYVVTDIGWNGSWRKANVWKGEEMQEEGDEIGLEQEVYENDDEIGIEYQVYKSRLRHQRASKAKFKKV